MMTRIRMTRMMMRRMMTKMMMTSVMIIVVDLNPCSARSAKLISIDKCVLLSSTVKVYLIGYNFAIRINI